jgi:CRISPR-associated protein Cmr4
MFKKSNIMFMYAETGLHVGGGDSIGVIDLAIQREKVTDFPMIAGSGIKGALRSWFETSKPEDKKSAISTIFGPESGADHSGALSASDARLLLFPVRSLKGVFAWITCPDVLHRLKRDLSICSTKTDFAIPTVISDKVIVTTSSDLVTSTDDKVVLEEFTFKADKSDTANAIALWIAQHAFPQTDEYEYWRGKIMGNLLIVSNDDFRDFAKNSTEVQTRIKINDETGTVDPGALFYQENLPGECLLYSVLMVQNSYDKKQSMNADEVEQYVCEIDKHRFHIGGDVTVGKGLVCARILKANQ